MRGACQLLPAWAAQYDTWLLIKLTPKGVDFSFLSAAALMFPGAACTFMQLQSSPLHFMWLQLKESVLPQCVVRAQDMYSATEGLLQPLPCTEYGTCFTQGNCLLGTAKPSIRDWPVPGQPGTILGFSLN